MEVGRKLVPSPNNGKPPTVTTGTIRVPASTGTAPAIVPPPAPVPPPPTKDVDTGKRRPSRPTKGTKPGRAKSKASSSDVNRVIAAGTPFIGPSPFVAYSAAAKPFFRREGALRPDLEVQELLGRDRPRELDQALMAFETTNFNFSNPTPSDGSGRYAAAYLGATVDMVLRTYVTSWQTRLPGQKSLTEVIAAGAGYANTTGDLSKIQSDLMPFTGMRWSLELFNFPNTPSTDANPANRLMRDTRQLVDNIRSDNCWDVLDHTPIRLDEFNRRKFRNDALFVGSMIETEVTGSFLNHVINPAGGTSRLDQQILDARGEYRKLDPLDAEVFNPKALFKCMALGVPKNGYTTFGDSRDYPDNFYTTMITCIYHQAPLGEVKNKYIHSTCWVKFKGPVLRAWL